MEALTVGRSLPRPLKSPTSSALQAEFLPLGNRSYTNRDASRTSHKDSYIGCHGAGDVRPKSYIVLRPKEQFLGANPEGIPSDGVRETYQQLLSKHGLVAAPPEALILREREGGQPGKHGSLQPRMEQLGSEEAASKVRESIEYLLYRSDDSSIADRLTNLIKGEATSA
jgi:hypothetical protein